MAGTSVRLSRVELDGAVVAFTFDVCLVAAAFYQRMLAEVEAIPGVESAAAVTTLPMSEVGIDFDLPFEVDGRPAVAKGEEPQADFRIATPGYFETLRIPLRRGRRFDDRDREGTAPVMLINDTMARRHFPGEDPIGRFVTMPMGGKREIVGVVADLRHYGLDRAPRPEMYLPYGQLAFSGLTVVARTHGDPSGLAASAIPALRAMRVDPVAVLAAE